MLQQDSLWLYNLTLRPPSNTFSSIVGNFSGEKKVQELVVATNTTIEVYRPNVESGKLEKYLTQKAFALIQRIDKIRMTGTTKDLLVMTADSGMLTILLLQPSMRFVPIVQVPHSKNSLRRLTPGEYLCVEPRGRAIFVAAIERDAFAYKVEKDENSSIALSSPLTISTKNNLTLCVCALDTVYENPMWAAIEMDYAETRSAPTLLLLAYYELDQGLNHIVRRKSKHSLPSSATLLIPMPGFVGGVIVCCDKYLIYEDGSVNNNRLYLQLPIRSNSDDSTIVCYLLHTLKKNDFFLLLQSSLGDLFKVTVNYDQQKEKVINLTATYFDTIAVCHSINVFKAGYFFANTTVNNKCLYQFELLGEENDTTVRSVETLEEIENLEKFVPLPLQNLALVSEIDTLGPLVDSVLVDTVSANSPDPLKRLVTASSDSYLKTMDYGLSVLELVSSPLPLTPTDIFTARLLKAAVEDQYLVLSSSLSQKTLILSIGEVVEEVTDAGLETNQHTLAVQQIGALSLVQVHTNGVRNVRHVLDEENNVVSKTITDWFPPAGIVILHASCNHEQIVIGLSNREIVYFEVDNTDDQLLEYQQRFEVDEGSITALCIATNLINERRSAFLVVGSSDESIQVLSLLEHNCLEVLTLQALSSTCRSLLLLPVDKDTLYVHIGMENGIYVRVGMDPISGKLFDSRLKYLGIKPVKLRSLMLPNMKHAAILAFSSRPWLGYFNYDKNLKLFPLLNSSVTSAASFFSEEIGVESCVGVHGDTLTIFTIGGEEGAGLDYNSDFVLSLLKLRYAPRRLLKAAKALYYVLESLPNTILAAVSSLEQDDEEDKNKNKIDQEDQDEQENQEVKCLAGHERRIGSWASCIQLVNHDTQEIVQTIEFTENKHAICMAQAEFDGVMYLVVSVVKDRPLGALLYTYKIDTEQKLSLVHETKVDAPVCALTAFKGKLCVALGGQLRVYEMGKKQLLRKSSTNLNILTRVNKLEYLEGGLFAAADANSSVVYLNFNSNSNHFEPLISDTASRAVTAFVCLDKRTVAAGDKFGNIFVSRVPLQVATQMSNNVLSQFQDEFLNGPSFRLLKLCDFYVGDVVTSFHKGSFVVGGTESLIYTGIQGTVGIMMPLGTNHEVQFLLNFENSMRKHYEKEVEDVDKLENRFNLAGREHLKFRGYYNPVKNVLDGDFLERYYELDPSLKIKIASELGRVPREVERKLYDLRNRAAF